MANVNIKFNNKEFLLSCEDGQEEHLEELSFHLNEKFNKLKSDLGNLGEAKLLLITTIQIMDELLTVKSTLKKLKDHNNELEKKFKEIKDLSITYKENSDLEVRKLDIELSELKASIENNEKNYTEIINKVNDSINAFITKAS